MTIHGDDPRLLPCFWTIDNLVDIERALSTPRDVALERMRCLYENDSGTHDCGEKTNRGLPMILTSLLDEAFNTWVESINGAAERKGWHLSHERIISPAQGRLFCSGEEKKNPDEELDELKLKEGKDDGLFLVAGTVATESLRCILNIHRVVSRLDQTLGEELGRAGSHAILSRLIRMELPSLDMENNVCQMEEDVDAFMELQDYACEISLQRCVGQFPLRFSPYTEEELQGRLPLSFDIEPISTVKTTNSATDEKCQRSKGYRVLVNQVTIRQSAQQDVGFVMWPSAVALSRWLVTNPSILEGKTVLELGSGCGLPGLVAASIVARRVTPKRSEADKDKAGGEVILTDFNDVVLENIRRNIELNEVSDVASACKLDFFAQKGSNHTPGGWEEGDAASECLHRPAVDLILAADVICQPEDATALANTIHDALQPPIGGRRGGEALVVCADSKHRFGVESFGSECDQVGLDVSSMDVSDFYDGQLFGDGIEKTSGYVEGMKFIFFRIRKI